MAPHEQRVEVWSHLEVGGSRLSATKAREFITSIMTVLACTCHDIYNVPGRTWLKWAQKRLYLKELRSGIWSSVELSLWVWWFLGLVRDNPETDQVYTFALGLGSWEAHVYGKFVSPAKGWLLWSVSGVLRRSPRCKHPADSSLYSATRNQWVSGAILCTADPTWHITEDCSELNTSHHNSIQSSHQSYLGSTSIYCAQTKLQLLLLYIPSYAGKKESWELSQPSSVLGQSNRQFTEQIKRWLV